MNAILLTAYPWTKALHLIAAISWMAGLLYLPRIFVYHAENALKHGNTSEVLKTMERRLLKYIMYPSMLMTWIFGIALILTPGVVTVSEDLWFQVKFIAVAILTLFHFWLAARSKDFAKDANRFRAVTYRRVNEIPTILMIVIVVMVIAKPFG